MQDTLQLHKNHSEASKEVFYLLPNFWGFFKNEDLRSLIVSFVLGFAITGIRCLVKESGTCEQGHRNRGCRTPRVFQIQGRYHQFHCWVQDSLSDIAIFKQWVQITSSALLSTKTGASNWNFLKVSGCNCTHYPTQMTTILISCICFHILRERSTCPVKQVGLLGLVQVVFEILVIFTSYQQNKTTLNQTKLELNSTLCSIQNDPNLRVFYITHKNT